MAQKKSNSGTSRSDQVVDISRRWNADRNLGKKWKVARNLIQNSNKVRRGVR